MIKYFYKICLFVLIFGQISFAQELNAKFYTNTFQAHVGDTVTLNLKINPQTGKPVYTVSATLMYDPSQLEYLDASFGDNKWFPLSTNPHILTDTINGMIRRTAGFPNGTDSLSDFTTYKFRALKEGKAKVAIEDGFALDEADKDIGLQQKEISINILPATATTSKKAFASIQNMDISLDILGHTAVYKENPYSFTIYENKKDIGNSADNTASTKIFVYDDKSNLYFTDTQKFDSTQNTLLTFTIPADTMGEGDYLIVAETTYSNGTVDKSFQKNIGVLSNGGNWFTKHENIFLPFFIFIIFISVVHHVLKEKDLYSKIEKIRARNEKLKRVIKSRR